MTTFSIEEVVNDDYIRARQWWHFSTEEIINDDFFYKKKVINDVFSMEEVVNDGIFPQKFSLKTSSIEKSIFDDLF